MNWIVSESDLHTAEEAPRSANRQQLVVERPGPDAVRRGVSEQVIHGHQQFKPAAGNRLEWQGLTQLHIKSPFEHGIETNRVRT